RSLQTIRRDIPPTWAMIVQYCLQKNPDERYRSAREVFEDLRADTCRYMTGDSATGANEMDAWLADLDNQFASVSPSPSAASTASSEKTVRLESGTATSQKST
ncbi:MAG TPA: hypothetical protein VJZ27_17800, partial [Aggregatilineales bacterium]|nr:hypothetical protein [Aggregatilineales bacterium]